MTAFASIILAALPGVSARSGDDGAVTADGQAMAGQGGGAFQALMAGLTAAAPGQPDASGSVATPLLTPTAAVFGAGLGDVAAAPSALLRDEAVTGFPTAADDGMPESSDRAEALAAAGAVVIAPAATASKSFAASAEPAASGASGTPPTGRSSAGDLAPSAETTSVANDTVQRPAVGEAVIAAVAPSPAQLGTGQVQSDLAAILAAQTPDAPVARNSVVAAPQPAIEAVTSLIGRILEGARRPEAEAAVLQAAAEAAPPAEAVADAVVDTPVELALDTALSPDAPAPVEAAVVETPVAPPPTSGRRTARPDAARADGAGQAADASAPDLKTASRIDALPTGEAAPASLARAEPPLAFAPVADLGAQADAADQATLDTAPATATLQAAAEMPAETAPTRGSPETVARLASDIAHKLEGKTTRFDVQLDPLGLGKVDVSIEINADGRLSASLSFDSAQTAADLRSRAGELRQALEKAGFDLADGGLSFDMNNPGGSGGRETRETLAAWSSRAFQTARSGLEQADALAARPISSRTPSGGVDIRI
jgi:hypothetical protein